MRVLILSILLSSCATYNVEIGEPVIGSNEQIIHPLPLTSGDF